MSLKPYQHEERFHELLIKKVRGTLTIEESAEYERLDKERHEEIEALEAPDVARLASQIQRLKQAIAALEHYSL